jgi:uncharacterized protein (TIGR02145 family)
MKLLFSTILFFLSSVLGYSQSKISTDFYGKENIRAELCDQSKGFMSEQDVEGLIANILSMQGLNNRFVVLACTSVDNCIATIDKNNRPVILYNPNFLKSVKKLGFKEADIPSILEKDWSTLTILAHEIGHHLNNHITNPLPGATEIQIELEADKTAGFLVYLMGGTLEKAKMAFQGVSETGNYSHPKRQDRIAALTNGYDDAKNKFPKIIKTIVTNPGSSKSEIEQEIVTKNYNSVKIGAQEWMTKNLDVDRFRNGDLILEVQGEDAFRQAGIRGQPAWCYYNSDPLNGEKFGKLYNWFAVNDPRGLAPQGWHIPSLEELKVLVKFAGGKDIAGQKLKSKFDWISNDAKFPLKRGIDFFGFSALPGSSHNSFGFIDGSLNGSGFWWTSTKEVYDNIITDAYFWSIYAEANYININATSIFSGMSIRCIKD